MVCVLLADGFEEIEAIFPIDILRRGGVPVTVYSLMEGTTVTGAHGIPVTADARVPEELPSETEMLLLPGGMPGAATIDAFPLLTTFCDTLLQRGGHIAAICAAPMALGRRGLLRGRRATCFPGFETYLDGAILSPERVVTDGPFTTAVGMGAAGELGLRLLSILRGRETADSIAATAKIRTERNPL